MVGVNGELPEANAGGWVMTTPVTVAIGVLGIDTAASAGFDGAFTGVAKDGISVEASLLPLGLADFCPVSGSGRKLGGTRINWGLVSLSATYRY